MLVDKDVSFRLSIEVKEPLKRKEAAALVEGLFADNGLVITPVGTNSVRISRKMKLN